MRLCQIVEAEVDPKTGEIHRWVDRNKLLRKYAGDKSVFAHFSDVNKLGLNPSSSFDTPIGIYAYPVDYVIKSFRHDYDAGGLFDVPFAADRKYAIIFKVQDLSKYWTITNEDNGANYIADRWSTIVNNMVRIDNTGNPVVVYDGNSIENTFKYSDLRSNPNDDDDDADIYSSAYEGPKPKLWGSFFTKGDWLEACYKLIGPDLKWLGPEIDLPGFDGANESAKRLINAFGLDDSQLNAIKFLTTVNDFLYRRWDASSDDDLLWRLCRAAGRFMSNNTAVGWSKVLMKMGYDGVIDNGNSVIHPSEPTQAVFFKIAGLQHLETIKNIFDAGRTKHAGALDPDPKRMQRSEEMRRILANDIPPNIRSMLKTSTFMVEIDRINHLVRRVSIARDPAKMSGMNKLFNSLDLLKTLAEEHVDCFEKHRRSLIIFKKNAPNRYAAIRPTLLECFKTYKEALEDLTSDEILIKIADAFDRLSKTI